MSSDPTNTTTTSTKKLRPGSLKTPITLTLHTVDAQFLLLGYSKAPKLTHFSQRMSQLWLAADKDDPYADYYLLKTYQMLTTLKQELASTIQECEQPLARHNQGYSLQIRRSRSEKPVVTTLFFNNQYGYLAASLIAAFDRLLCLTITAYRIGASENYNYDSVRQQWQERIASALQLPFQWQPLNITRKDVIEKNELALSAEQSMAPLPDTILQQSERSPFAPHRATVKTES